MHNQPSSFQEYKKYLEDSLGMSSVQPPMRPMNPYMRFFLERSSEERSKGRSDWTAITRQLAGEWKNLAVNKRDYYEKIYEIRNRERNALHEEFEKLTKNRKPLMPYARFVKKRYVQYSKEYKHYNSSEINRLIKEEWKTISTKEKAKLQHQYDQEKQDADLNVDKSDLIEEYKEKVGHYHEELKEEKEKIMKRYGITDQSRKRQKQQEKEKERQKKKAEKQLLREQKKRVVQEQKQHIRDAKLKKAKEQREEQNKIREKQRLQQKEAIKIQREKLKEEETQKKQKQAQKAKKGDKKKVQTVKEEAKQVKKGAKTSKSVAVKKAPASKGKGQKAKKVAPLKKVETKTKKIKKASKAVKKEQKGKSSASKGQGKAKSKPQAKAKKAASKTRRGK